MVEQDPLLVLQDPQLLEEGMLFHLPPSPSCLPAELYAAIPLGLLPRGLAPMVMGCGCAGIVQMRQLWDVDPAALADSDPWKLALAVRALTKSSNALPRTF